MYDFLLLYPEKRGYGTHYLPVKNDIKGIGNGKINYTSLYGSNGNLQGIIVIGSGSKDYQITPVPNDTLLHEFTHRWSAYLNKSKLELSTGCHWKNNNTILGLMHVAPADDNCFTYNGD